MVLIAADMNHIFNRRFDEVIALLEREKGPMYGLYLKHTQYFGPENSDLKKNSIFTLMFHCLILCNFCFYFTFNSGRPDYTI